MVIAKGEIINPNGRPAGVPNKATSKAREAIAAFVDGNASRLNRLLDKIEAKDPKQAFDAIMSVCEYHLPKLARSEIENKMSIAFEPLVIRQINAETVALASVPTEQPTVIEGEVVCSSSAS